MTDTMTRPVVAPLEEVTPIRYSEAVRLGCLVAPVQAFKDYTNGPGSACALGAMAYGLGWDGESDPGSTDGVLRPFYEVSIRRDYACPEDGCSRGGWPPHLNDDHRWTREHIADWLEGLGL